MNTSTITEYEEYNEEKSSTKTDRVAIFKQPPKGHVPAEQPLIWLNIIFLAVLHASTIYMFATRYHEAKFWTWIWGTYISYQSTCQLSFQFCRSIDRSIEFSAERAEIGQISIERYARNWKSAFSRWKYPMIVRCNRHFQIG